MMSSDVLMPCWYYAKEELHNTPSVRDGIAYDKECRYRREGAILIINIGVKMELGYNTIATGIVYFHRFYMIHSFRNFPRYVTACSCLFLAGKVEETPKKCNDVIETARSFLPPQKFLAFGKEPKEEVITLEKILLQTIKFDFEVEHPYRYLPKYTKCLKGEKNKLQDVLQQAWDLVSYSLCTTLCLRWKPEIIAISLLFLASKFKKFRVVDWAGRTSKHRHWWDMFVDGLSVSLLEDIGHQVLDIYEPKMPTAHLPIPQPPREWSSLPQMGIAQPVAQQLQLVLPEVSIPPPHFTTSSNRHVQTRGRTRDQSLHSPFSPVAPTSSGIPAENLNGIKENGRNKSKGQGPCGALPSDKSSALWYQHYPPPVLTVPPPQSIRTQLTSTTANTLPPVMPTSHGGAYVNSSDSQRHLLYPDMYQSSASGNGPIPVPPTLHWRQSEEYV